MGLHVGRTIGKILVYVTKGNIETSEQVADGDILQNVLKELEPEQDYDDDPNDDPDGSAEQDPDYIHSTGQLLHMVNHQKAFLQCNKFPVEVL